jgi:hypothetical protein
MRRLMFVFVLLSLSFALFGCRSPRESSAHTLRVQILDENNMPMEGVRIRLQLYEFKQRGDSTIVRRWYRDALKSNADGVVVFHISNPPGDGILRGTLHIEDKTRPVIWPGGDLFVPLRIDRLDDGREAMPFEFNVPYPLPIVNSGGRLWFVGIGTLVIVVFVGIFWVRSRRMQ